MSEETRRADNLAFEMKKLEEKHETIMKEKEVRRFSHTPLALLSSLSRGSRSSLTELHRICLTPSEDHHGARVSEGDQRGAALQPGAGATVLPSR